MIAPNIDERYQAILEEHPSTSPGLRTTAGYNAAGVICLALGQAEQALNFFTTAINAYAADHTFRLQEIQTDEFLPYRVPPCLRIPGVYHDILQAVDTTLSFDPNSAVHNLKGASRHCCISAILLFNKALCLHVQGNLHSCDELLRQALTIYTQAAQAMALIPSVEYTTTSILVFLFGVWNNQGVVAYQLGDKRMACQYFENLRAMATELLQNEMWQVPAAKEERKLLFQWFINNDVIAWPLAAATA